VLDPFEDHDRRLRDGLAAGRAEALAEAYECHAPAVYGLALRLSGDQGTAEDITQEVFVELWRRPDGYDPGRAPLRGWLCMIARRRAIDWLRRRRVQHRAIPALSVEPATVDLEDEVLLKQVRSAVEDLAEPHRQAILLAYYKGLTYREVAEALGIPEGTAKSRLRMALRLVADKLRAMGFTSAM
jgi:RNA polymerase sigma factor (sigma-70 family)